MSDVEGSGQLKAAGRERPRLGLSWKLLWLTVLFMMISVVLIYLPSIANYRVNWLRDRLAIAEAAAVVLTASSWTDVPRSVQDNLLALVGADGVVLRSGGASHLLATVETLPEVQRTTDLRVDHPLEAVVEALDTLLAANPRFIRVIGETAGHDSLELLMHDQRLRAAMLGFSVNVLFSSLLISVITGALVFLAVNRVLVRPMRRMTANMIAFSRSPEDVSRVIEPSQRGDEIGIAEEHLALMQRDLQATLQQQRRLADLGLAVSKINHDLRNLLASAQLFSDRLRGVSDASVQSFAPKLIATLDRAIAYCQATLSYGRPSEQPPERRMIALHGLAEEVAATLALDSHREIEWENRVPPSLEVDADPDHVFRILLNLSRNAVQAMEGGSQTGPKRLTVEGVRTGGVVSIRVRDTGPGISEKARANLFRAFQGSARTGGTGLGLPIAADLLRAHGGTIAFAKGDNGRGAVFEIAIPDRPLEFTRAERKRG